MKHKLLITGLATATLLSTAALTHFSTSVYAEGETITKQDVANYFTELEKQAEEAINANDKIANKETAILAAKAAIGKEDLLNAIDEKEISPEDVLKDLAKASVSSESQRTTSAPVAELVRNEKGEVTEVKSENGGIPEEVAEKINKRLDEEKTDVKDAEERLAAAKHDEKEAENNREEAKAAVESAKENVKAAKEELAVAKDSKSKEEAEKTLKQAEQELKDAEAALKQADEDYYSYVADREVEEVRVLRRQIAKDKADGKDTQALEEELDNALYGVEPASHELKEYNEPITAFVDENGNPIEVGELGTVEPKKIPYYTHFYTKKEGNVTKHFYKTIVYLGHSTPVNGTPAPAAIPTPGTPAPVPAPAQTPAATPNAEVPATPAEATSEEAALVAEAAQAEKSKKEELPNTGTAELGLFTPAVLSILASLGLTFGKKEDK